jgi:propanol-preferring alcohol dehydrogenase
MRAWVVARPGPIDSGPLELLDRAVPTPRARDVRVRVTACGVCRTDLHLAEGDLPPRHPAVVPGHEIVGVVDEVGADARRFSRGDRVGIAWLRATCARCRFCRRGDENLCAAPRFTGWDEDGGYAEFAVVHEDYAYRLPATFDDEHAAPLLCAGIIGYRALRRAGPGDRLGVYGFGASAHIAAQIALHEGATVHVVTRSARARALASSLGVASARDPGEGPPQLLDRAVVFAPSGAVVRDALRALDRGGRLAIAGVYLSDVPSLRYADHLFYEREVTSVTANTRRDGRELLRLAAEIPLRTTTTAFGLGEADDALRALAHGRLVGAGVLLVASAER